MKPWQWSLKIHDAYTCDSYSYASIILHVHYYYGVNLFHTYPCLERLRILLSHCKSMAMHAETKPISPTLTKNNLFNSTSCSFYLTFWLIHAIPMLDFKGSWLTCLALVKAWCFGVEAHKTWTHIMSKRNSLRSNIYHTDILYLHVRNLRSPCKYQIPVW